MNSDNSETMNELIHEYSTDYGLAIRKLNEWSSAILTSSFLTPDSEAEQLITCFYALLEDAEILKDTRVNPEWSLPRMRKELARHGMRTLSAIMKSWYSSSDDMDETTAFLSRLRPVDELTYLGLSNDFNLKI
jgi:hypothetical protein